MVIGLLCSLGRTGRLRPFVVVKGFVGAGGWLGLGRLSVVHVLWRWVVGLDGGGGRRGRCGRRRSR